MPADVALGPSLSEIRVQLQARVDAEAEAARAVFVTPGAGQAMEYMATETDARAYLIAISPTLSDYPFLEAEVRALEDAFGGSFNPNVVAQAIEDDADAWRVAGAQIKRLRRAAKMKIDLAASVAAAIAAATDIPWPTPRGTMRITFGITGTIFGVATLTGHATSAISPAAELSA